MLEGWIARTEVVQEADVKDATKAITRAWR